MKKITLTLVICVAAVMSFGHVSNIFNAPPDNGSTTQVRAPNGTV